MFTKKTSQTADQQYASIFARRGREYNRGMLTYPLARAQEFKVAVNALAPKSGETVLDAPSGGGYLQGFLPKDLELRLIEVDPAPEFRPSGALGGQTSADAASRQSIIAPLEAMPVEGNSCDGVVSIAGLHHARDLHGIFAEFRRVLKPSGRLVILEVDKGSPVDTFLNTFVDQYNSGGHSGEFIDTEFLRSLSDSGFRITKDCMQRYTWDFATRRAMIEFTRLVFGLDLADDYAVLGGIGDTLGFTEHADGSCAMNWELRLVTAD